VAARILVRSRKPGPDVDTYRAAKVDRCDRAQPVQFDGDTVEPTDRLDLEVDPSSLTLAVPEPHHVGHDNEVLVGLGRPRHRYRRPARGRRSDSARGVCAECRGLPTRCRGDPPAVSGTKSSSRTCGGC